MIELQKVVDALNTDKGKKLTIEYSVLLYRKNPSEIADDVQYVKGVAATLARTISEGAVVPEDFETQDYIFEILTNMIESLEEELQGVDAAQIPESIPPRPYHTGSRYLNPEEVDWLVKYDPKVKSAVAEGITGFRIEHPVECAGASDDVILDTLLDKLYRLNRRDPEIVEQLPGAGPSFFKQYEEGTPEEIVIRYFNYYSDGAEDYEDLRTTYSSSKTTTSKYASTSDRKTELLEQKKHNQILGIVFLFVFWPVGIYFFYKASQISKEIDSL